jgi:choline dehydrogenase-like flavoprotein
VVPSSPAVNPQLTIMALATRAADRLADKLS